MSEFESMLAEGKPNSLGRTVEVVDTVLKDNTRFDELYNCYFSDDEWVRLRVSNAMKRIGKEKLELLIPYTDKFLDSVSQIGQASAQWTLSQLYLMLEDHLSDKQRSKAVELMRKNLKHDDWIVLNATVETLAQWAKHDDSIKKWLLPELVRISKDPHKSVARRAQKHHDTLA